MGDWSAICGFVPAGEQSFWRGQICSSGVHDGDRILLFRDHSSSPAVGPSFTRGVEICRDMMNEGRFFVRLLLFDTPGAWKSWYDLQAIEALLGAVEQHPAARLWPNHP